MVQVLILESLKQKKEVNLTSLTMKNKQTKKNYPRITYVAINQVQNHYSFYFRKPIKKMIEINPNWKFYELKEI